MDRAQPESKEGLRSKVCEVHGLRYDPATQTGCVRCRGGAAEGAGGAQSAARRSGPPLVAWLLAAGAAVLLAILLFGREPTPSPADSLADGETEGSSTTTPGAISGGTEDSAEASQGSPATGQPAASGWPTFEAVGTITVEDSPEDEPFRIGDLLAPDLESVRFQAAAGALVVTFEFTQNVDSHAFEFNTGMEPATVLVDTDLDAATGEKGFAGREGFEWAIQSYVGVKYDSEADSYWWVNGLPDTPIVEYACSHDVGTVSGYFLDLDFDPSDQEALDNTSCFGTTLEVTVPYELLNVAAGQTIRLATEENMGSGTLPQYFLADVLLTLD